MQTITEDDSFYQIEAPSMAVALQKAEVDQQVSTARAYPRSLKRVQSKILDMALLDEESADECIFSLPRGGKPIKGASIRFAEILQQSYGNCSSGARVVHVDKKEMYVEAEGVFNDLESNSRTVKRVRRSIQNKHGKIFSDDMITVTSNAACSIALRNAIMAGVPKPLWRKAYQAVENALDGGIKTLSERRTLAIRAFSAWGVTPEQIFSALDVEGLEDITAEHLITLTGIKTAVKAGEYTVESYFGEVKKPEAQAVDAENKKQAQEGAKTAFRALHETLLTAVQESASEAEWQEEQDMRETEIQALKDADISLWEDVQQAAQEKFNG